LTISNILAVDIFQNFPAAVSYLSTPVGFASVSKRKDSLLMNKKLKRMFWTIEINAVLWFLMFGFIGRTNVEFKIKAFAFVGLVVAAVLQHLAYCDVYKKIKETA
jgi:hypothetical protein